MMHALKLEWKAICWLMWLQDRCALVSLQCTECASSECSRAHVVRLEVHTFLQSTVFRKYHFPPHPPLPATLLHTGHKVPDPHQYSRQRCRADGTQSVHTTTPANRPHIDRFSTNRLGTLHSNSINGLHRIQDGTCDMTVMM